MVERDWCSYCGAKDDEPCRSPNTGRPRKVPHAARARAPVRMKDRPSAVNARRAFSQEVKRRAAGWCEAHTPDCPPGRHYGQHAHHVVPRGRGGGNDPTNGLWVCWRAHDFIHRHPQASVENGWLAPGK